MIYILSGPVRTGKTSALLNWCKNRNDVDGLLCPDDENGKRYFLKVKSKNTLRLEIESSDENDIISVGPFHFSKKVFEEANEYLISLIHKSDYKYVIIDELGKLELKDSGLHLAAKTLILRYSDNENLDLILIVRESLLDAIIEHYTISNYRILKKEDLEKLD